MSLETYVKEEEFQKVLDFALDRNLLKLFFQDQDLENLQDTRKHVLKLLKKTTFNLKQLRTESDSDHHIYVDLAKEAMEFVKLKQENNNC